MDEKSRKKRRKKTNQKKKLDRKKLKDYARAREEEKKALNGLKEKLDLRKGYEPEIQDQIEEVKMRKEEKIDTEEKKKAWKQYQEAKKKRQEIEKSIPGKVPKTYNKIGFKEDVFAQGTMAGYEKTQETYGYREKDWKIGLENVEGKTLKEAVKNKKTKNTIKNNMEEFTDQMADILAEMTKRGVTHGDIHPDNLVIKEKQGKPKVKLIDFDVAQMNSKIDHSLDHFVKRDFRDTVKNISNTLDVNPDKFRKKLGKKYEEKIEEKM